MKCIRLVLKGNAGEDALDAFADAWGWRRIAVAPGEPHAPAEKIWESTRVSARIRYVDDSALGLRYLEISGDGTDDIASWAAILLPLRGADDLDEMVRSVDEPESWIPLMYLVAIMGSVAFDPERFLILGNGFAHFDARVRQAALRASGYLRWKAFEAPLERLKAADPDMDVRVLAGRMLAMQRERGWV